MEHFLKAYNFACTSIWRDHTCNEIIFEQAKKAYSKLKKNCTAGKKIFRLTGQSGSGKTSQLLKATKFFCNKHNIKPIHIAVRNFAKYFPEYKNIKNKKNFRELTNGFALKVLIWVLKFAFEDGLDIILEIALLNKNFEKYIFFEILNKNYKLFFQIIAINKKLSNYFIIKRQKKNNRLTSNRSANYFNKMIIKTFKYLTKKYNFNCIIWSAFAGAPVYFGSCKNAYKIFIKIKRKIQKTYLSENQLLEFKRFFLEELYRDEIF